MHTPESILAIKNVSKTYGDIRALDGVSFSLREGEVVCLLGPSGSGKTTLLRCLAGLEPIDTGSIEYFGTYQLDTERNDARQIRKLTSFVFQDFQLWPNQSVLDNIVLAPMAVKNISREEATKTAESLLKRFGLADHIHSRPDFLSGGQKQRVAIIRALAVHPRILFLDEITSALDPELIRGVLNVIKILAKEGQTMVIATHHLRFAAEIADRIVFLDKGRMTQEAPVSEFLYAQSNSRIRDFVKSISSSEQEINVFEGYDEFQSYHLGVVRRLKEGATINVGAAVGDRWYECMGKYCDEWEKTRVRKNIILRMLLYHESPYNKREREMYPLITQNRQLPQEGPEEPVNYNVNEDIVAIQLFGNVPSVIEIKNPDLAKSYLRFFELLWNNSKEIK